MKGVLILERTDGIDLNKETLMDQYYKPKYSVIFNKIKDIRAPLKSDIIIALMDGNWHSERDLIRLAKKQQQCIGAVTLGTMISSLNHMLSSNYVEKQMIEGKLYYKISDSFVGLTRAAYTRYCFSSNDKIKL